MVREVIMIHILDEELKFREMIFESCSAEKI